MSNDLVDAVETFINKVFSTSPENEKEYVDNLAQFLSKLNAQEKQIFISSFLDEVKKRLN